MHLAATLLFAILAAMHCASVDTKAINAKALAAAGAAERLANAGKMAEAQAFIYQLQYLHPDDVAVRRLQDRLTIDYRSRLEALKLLGVNAVRKKPIERTTAQKVMYFIPDLLGDLKDIASFDISIGPQFGFDVHATRAANFTGYAGLTAALGTYPKQWLALRTEAGFEAGVGPVGVNAISGEAASITTTKAGSEAFVVHRPVNTLYQTYRDFWSAGGKLGLFIIGVSFEVHPLEAADFFTALYGGDLLDDNFQATEDFAFSAEDAKLLGELSSFVSEGRLGKYKEDFPDLKYASVSAKGDSRRTLASASGKAGPAKVLVLNFSNHTGSKNYGYISTSLSSAIYDSLKAGFVFAGENPDRNEELLGEQRLPSAPDINWYGKLCAQTEADYIVVGSFTRDQKDTLAIVAHVYGAKQNRILQEISRTTKTDVSLFSTTQQISDAVIALMKKLPAR